MKHLPLLLGLSLLLGHAYAQGSLQRVTFSGGARDDNRLTATVGEPFAGYAKGGSNASLSMGAQPGADLTGVGVQQPLVLDGVTVYPNPTSGSIWMKIEHPAAEGAACTVTDLSGRTILTQPAATGLNHLDIRTQPAGMYLVTLTLGDATRSFRVVKQ